MILQFCPVSVKRGQEARFIIYERMFLLLKAPFCALVDKRDKQSIEYE